MATARLDRRTDVKTICAKAHEILIARATRRAQNLEVVDRLEQVRLALAVFADDDEAVGRRRQIDVSEIAKVADDETIESRRSGAGAHVPLKFAARFSRNARVPSRLSSVAASSPNAVASSASASSSDAS